AELEPLNNREVAFWRCPLEIIQKLPPPTDHHEHAASAGEVFAMDLQMLGESLDPRGQNRDLNFGRTGVCLACPKLLNQLALLFFGNGHLSSARSTNFPSTEHPPEIPQRRYSTSTLTK